MSTEPSVLLALPSRGVFVTGTTLALMQMGKTKVYGVRSNVCSLLAMTFNTLWCQALNERGKFTHFVMLHDDIVPEAGWLDVLMNEMVTSDADVVSSVVPIKDDRGITSTAFLDPETMLMRRLTVTEACAIKKKTFDAADAGYPSSHCVLPNTGLWACKFTDPWVEKVCFTVRDRIFKDSADGLWKPQTYSEDWDFGVQCMRLGVKVKATTAVKLTHKGGFDYPNMVPWGSLKEDNVLALWDETVAVGNRKFNCNKG